MADDARKEAARRELMRRRAQMELSKRRETVQQGQILPISRNAQGDVSFDSNAGLLGVAKRAFTLPGEVIRGQVDPMSDEGIGRAAEMAATVSPVNPAMRAGDRLIPGAGRAMQRAGVKPPSAEALKREASGQYDAIRDMGVDYSAESVTGMAAALQRELEADGILPELAPKAYSVLRKLQQAPDNSVAPLAGLEAARRSFNQAAKDFNNPTDQLAAQRARETLDDFIMAADPASVVAGPASKAGRLVQDARGNYAAGKRSETLTGIEDAAELRAAVANSGQNLDNSTRQRLATLLLNQKQRAGFNPDERSAIEGVARGSRTANTLRATGNILGGGGGLGATVTGGLGAGGGFMAGGPVGAFAGAVIPPVVGGLAKRGAARMTQTGLRGIDEMTRARSPLYERMMAEAPMEAINVDRRAAIVRALLMADQASQ